MKIFSRATVKAARPGTKVLAVLTVALLAFIWIHSMMPPEASGEESSWVTLYIVQPFVSLITGGRVTVTEHFVRKLAHFTEYMVYSLIMTCFIGRLRADMRRSQGAPHGMLVRVPFIAWLTAFIDETIQIFSGRGPAIKDVWIDLGGACLGFAIGLIIVALSDRAFRRRAATSGRVGR